MMYIKVVFRVPGVHLYKEASGRYEYLKHPHRHIFHFSVWIQVIDDPTREIEFIQVEEELTNHMYKVIANAPDDYDYSCEFLATAVIDWCHVVFNKQRDVKVEVTEDGLNGVLLERVGE